MRTWIVLKCRNPRCPRPGGRFEVEPARSHSIYCSHSCASVDVSRRRMAQGLLPSSKARLPAVECVCQNPNCPNPGGKFVVPHGMRDRKYCSIACSASDPQRRKRGPSTPDSAKDAGLVLVCLNPRCPRPGGAFTVTPCERHRKYCSRECAATRRSPAV